MSEVQLGSPTTLEDLHERTWELVQRFSYMSIVFEDAEAAAWATFCSDAQAAVQCIREGLGLAMDDEIKDKFWPEHLTHGGISAAQMLEQIAAAEMTRRGLS